MTGPTTARTPNPLLRPALIVVVGFLAYHNSFSGVFLFDDQYAILTNPWVTQPRATLESSTPPARFLAYVTLAVNYELGGKDTWGYHLGNLIIHLLAALVLYQLVRSTLQFPRGGSHPPGVAANLACASALLWVCHPLTTQAVTYITQRMESQMALFYLLALLAAVRGISHTGVVDRRWSVAACLASALAMGTKQVAVTLPFVLLAFDRVYLSGSFRLALLRRWGMYLGLAASLSILAPSIMGAFFSPMEPNKPAEAKAEAPPAPTVLAPRWTAGFANSTVSPLDYARTQPAVILHYLELSVWPDPLCFDYKWPIARETQFGPTILLAALLAVALWACWQRPAIGFLAAFPFLVLAPTSSVLPIQDAAFEHRMYLPLASLCVLVVLAVDRLLRWASEDKKWSNDPGTIARGVLALVIVVYVTLTIYQNEYYHSEAAMARRIIELRPDNPRGYQNLGKAPGVSPAEAEKCFRRVIELSPTYIPAYYNLGVLLASQGRSDEAIQVFQTISSMKPNEPLSRYSIGMVLMHEGQVEAAIPYLREATRLAPAVPTYRKALDQALAQLSAASKS
jgi:hypothetical protein